MSNTHLIINHKHNQTHSITNKTHLITSTIKQTQSNTFNQQSSITKKKTYSITNTIKKHSITSTIKHIQSKIINHKQNQITQATRLIDNLLIIRRIRLNLSYLLPRSLTSRRPNSLLIAKNIYLGRGFVKISTNKFFVSTNSRTQSPF